MTENKFDVFIQIARKLNDIQITPLLMGSVGLEIVTRKDWQAQDLDIHIPGDERGWEVPAEKAIYKWESIVALMEEMAFKLVDLHEHEFMRNNLSVEFGIIDTLPSFAGVMLEDLTLHTTAGVQYYLLTPAQYLKLYEASAQDGYRAQNNNSKDIDKIRYLKL